VRRDDPRCHYPGADGEVGRKSSRDAETDDAIAAPFDRLIQCGAQMGDMAVKDGNAWTASNSGLEGEAGHGNDRPRRRAKCQVLRGVMPVWPTESFPVEWTYLSQPNAQHGVSPEN